MVRDDWEQALARAVVERSFRARLLADPADALVDYGLTRTEEMKLDGIRAFSLEDLVLKLVRALPETRARLMEALASQG